MAIMCGPGIGPVKVQIPKVRSRTGAPVSFKSALVPPYVRKAKTIEAALPWLYLKGISTGERGAALKAMRARCNGFLGQDGVTIEDPMGG